VRPQVQPTRSAHDAPVSGVAEENKAALALVCGKSSDELAARQKTPSSSRSNWNGAGAMRNPVHRVAYGNVAMARHVYREWRGRHSKWNSWRATACRTEAEIGSDAQNHYRNRECKCNAFRK
jgi:hypothetical protein